MVVTEGKPSQAQSFSLERPTKNLSATKKKEIAKRNANSIMEVLGSAKAASEEVDTLAAIQMSANMLNASELEEKNMLVVDSGLCTTGLLSLIAYNVLDTDPEIVVEKLDSIHALPELEGIKITWVGLAGVSGAQKELPDSKKHALKELWTKIIEKSGGTVNFDSTPIAGSEGEDLPNVTPIVFPEDSLGLENTANSIPEVVAFKEDTVKFVANRADFVDPSAAQKALEPIAEFLKANPDKSVLIAGTTANVGGGDGKQLSQKRTETVRDFFLENGVSPTQLKCVGLGCSSNCFRVEDRNPDGSLNETMAAKNRAIYIVLADSTVAKSVLGGSAA